MLKLKMLKLKMQHFAEDPVDPAPGIPAKETIPAADTAGTDPKQPEQVESVDMTQEEVDALVDKAFAKGARKGKREALVDPKTSPKPEAPLTTPEGAPEDQQVNEALKQADEKLALANKMLVKGSVLSLGSELLSPNGQKLLLETETFADCFDEKGNLVEEELKDKIAEFVKGYPELSKTGAPAHKLVIPPVGKVPLAGDFQTQLNEAREKGNTGLAVQIKASAAEKGINLR